MTRKDYNAIAKAIGEAAPHGDSHTLEQVTYSLVSYMAQDNPRFDRGRFHGAIEKAAEREAES